MKITKRQNNFESIPSSKILPGGCSCCSCCCCCLHGIGVGSAGATWGWKLGKTGVSKFFIALGLFILLGALGLGLDLGVGLGLLNIYDNIRPEPEEIIFFALYGISAMFFTYLAYRLVFKFTKNTKLNEVSGLENATYEQRKKAYHKSRFIFQLKLFGVYFVLGYIVNLLISGFIFSFIRYLFDSSFNFYYVLTGINLINIIIIYFVACFLDKLMKNKTITGYFFLIYLGISILSSFIIVHFVDFFSHFLNIFFLGGVVGRFIIIFFGFAISAFLFEYLRFKYIKSHPELFRK